MKVFIITHAVRQRRCKNENSCQGHDLPVETMKVSENFDESYYYEGTICLKLMNPQYYQQFLSGIIYNDYVNPEEYGKIKLLLNEKRKNVKYKCNIPDFSSLEEKEMQDELIQQILNEFENNKFSPGETIVIMLGLEKSKVVESVFKPLEDKLKEKGYIGLLATFRHQGFEPWKEFCRLLYEAISDQIFTLDNGYEVYRIINEKLQNRIPQSIINITTFLGEGKDGFAGLLMLFQRMLYEKNRNNFNVNVLKCSYIAGRNDENWNSIKQALLKGSEEIPKELNRLFDEISDNNRQELWRLWRTDINQKAKEDLIELAYCGFSYSALYALYKKYKEGMVNENSNNIWTRVLANKKAKENIFWLSKHFDWSDPLRDKDSWKNWENKNNRKIEKIINLWCELDDEGTASKEIKEIDKISTSIEGVKKCNKCEKYIVSELYDGYIDLQNKINSTKNSSGDLKVKIENSEDEDKKEFYEKFNNKNIIFLTGGPGTGKTTTVAEICAKLSKEGKNILALAPTGRAAVRFSTKLTQKLKEYGLEENLKAKTFHSAFGIEPPKVLAGILDDWGPMRPSKNGGNIDLLVIDEMSMVDEGYLIETFRRVNPKKVVLCGDPNQLPPVQGIGEPFTYLSEIEGYTVELTKNRRSEGTGIYPQAKKVLNGERPANADGVKIILCNNEDEIYKNLLEWCEEKIKYDNEHPFEKSQILAPTHHGEVGRIKLNKKIQEWLYTQYRDKYKLEEYINHYGFRSGDKVVCINNFDADPLDPNEEDKRIYNGEVGWYYKTENQNFVVRIDREDKYPEYSININDLWNFYLGYAITIHKSQGSEWDYVAVCLPNVGQGDFLNRNLLYTAITRAKKEVVIFTISDVLNRICATERKPRSSCITHIVFG